MLKVDPSKRLSISEALLHPWIQKFCIKRNIPDIKIHEFYKNIISFKVDNKYFFQHATLAFMVHHLTTREEVDDIRKLFFYIDKNGDGRIGLNEVINGFKKMINVNEKDLLRVFKFIDQGKTGFVEYEGN
jgi:calcium-dependent protein kinase